MPVGRQIVNYLGQVSTEVKADRQRLVCYCCQAFAIRFCILCEQSIDYSMSDENLTSTKHLLLPSYRQSTLLHMFFKSLNSPRLDSLQIEILVAHGAINALFTKKYRIGQQTLDSNSKQTSVYPL